MKIPICLVTGFLGSGKTTFLKNLVTQYRHRRLVYLVNEFSLLDIDGAIVSAENPDVISVPGGSIFCKCLVTAFIDQLKNIPATFGQIEGLVIEASGMANPKVMQDMLDETAQNQAYRLARVISMVDPGTFGKLCRTLPNIIAQIEAADLALITKTDVFSAEQVQAMRDLILQYNPSIQIIPIQNGHANVDLFPVHAEHPDLHGEYALCKDPLYETCVIELSAPCDPDELQRWLTAAGDEIYRLKGHVRHRDQSWYVDYTPSGFNTRIVAPVSDHALVLIHQPDLSPATQRWMHALK